MQAPTLYLLWRLHDGGHEHGEDLHLTCVRVGVRVRVRVMVRVRGMRRVRGAWQARWAWVGGDGVAALAPPAVR